MFILLNMQFAIRIRDLNIPMHPVQSLPYDGVNERIQSRRRYAPRMTVAVSGGGSLFRSAK